MVYGHLYLKQSLNQIFIDAKAMNLKSRMTVGPNDGSEAAKCPLTVVLVASPTAECRVCRVGLVASSDEAHATIGLCADEVW